MLQVALAAIGDPGGANATVLTPVFPAVAITSSRSRRRPLCENTTNTSSGVHR